MKDIEFIGFDLGHGETALATTMLWSDYEPKVVEIVPNKKAIITAVARHPSKGVLIGDNAYKERGTGYLKVRFKGPQLHLEEIREPTKLFVNQVVSQLKAERKIGGKSETHFLVGCPAGWREATRIQYKSLLQESGLLPVQVIAESRAAFLDARGAGYLGDVKNLTGSVLIIDIGSSTTDFTHVLQLKEKAIDFGENQLGAGLLDELIFRRTLDKHSQRKMLRKIFEEFPTYQAQCEIVSRKAKEDYFSNEVDYIDRPASAYMKIMTKRENIYFEVDLMQKDMNEILNKPLPELGRISWKEAYRKALINAKERVKDTMPEVVLLTGGASRMGFTLQICQEVFDTSRVKRGIEPECSIAKGLALAGRIDHKVNGFRAELNDLLHSKEGNNPIRMVVARHLPLLMDKIAPKLADQLIEHIIPAFEEWRQGNIKSLRRTQEMAGVRFEKWIKSPEGQTFLNPEVTEWLEYINPELERLTNPICRKYEIESGALGLATTKPDDVGFINMGDPIDITRYDDIGSIVTVVGSIMLAGALGGGGKALLISGPIGWIIGLIIGFFVIGAVIFGFGRDKFNEWIADFNMPVILRKTLSINYEGKVRGKRNEIAAQLKEAILNQKDSQELKYADKMAQEITDAIKHQLHQASNVAALWIV